MNYILKSNIEMIDFLKAIDNCEDTVFLNTNEGDKLNLQSQLSKFIFLATAIDKKYIASSTISCSSNDALLLKDYIE